NIPQESLKILKKVGEWMQRNAKSIYGCGTSGLPKPENGRITRCGDRLYFHIMEPSVGYVPLMGLKADEVAYLRRLCDGSELHIERNWITGNYSDVVFTSFGTSPELPDEVDTVVEAVLK
ncbi:MAG: alpha-L-fucosidase, partial [Eubacteriales bacterium]|nr:alpha-L-fucosidase [Eubacteriales bacterium]